MVCEFQCRLDVFRYFSVSFSNSTVGQNGALSLLRTTEKIRRKIEEIFSAERYFTLCLCNRAVF